VPNFLTNIDPDFLVYAGALGVVVGLSCLILFLYRRARWVTGMLTRKKAATPSMLASLRNLLTIMLWMSLFGMILFFGAFLRAYHVFTYEDPVAEIRNESTDRAGISQITLVPLAPSDQGDSQTFLIRGDQWMIEGDILKWDNWLGFLGLRTRYRLTRLRGRYLNTQDEFREPKTIYSLVEDEDHPLWRYLYQYGGELPFVSTVYGNAAFQAARNSERYLLYVGPSGFIVREAEEDESNRLP
jgi:hypothetical protein